MQISGNTILVTGGNSGIGLALARKFHKHRNRIIITGRNPDRLKQVLEDYPDWTGYECDFSDTQAITLVAEKIERNHADLNILINNAGIQVAHHFLNDPGIPENCLREMRINFDAPVRLGLHLLPVLLQADAAAIINVTSALGEVPRSIFPIYCASKAALSAYSTALRRQLAETPIRVMEWVPPLTATPMNAHRPGTKMSADDLAAAFLRALQKDCPVVRPGKAALLHTVHRIWPTRAQAIIEATP